MHREPYARLLLLDGTRLEGEPAEERLQALLGFSPAGKQGATADTQGLWGAPWVQQCCAVEQPTLSDGGRGALHACLETELGSLTGDDRGGALRLEVQAAFSRLLDGHGNPKGSFKEAAQELASVELDLARLRQKRASLASAIDEHARLRRALALASSDDEQVGLADDLREARDRRDVVLLYGESLAKAVTDRGLAEGRYEEAADEVARRAARCDGRRRRLRRTRRRRSTPRTNSCMRSAC